MLTGSTGPAPGAVTLRPLERPQVVRVVAEGGAALERFGVYIWQF